MGQKVVAAVPIFVEELAPILTMWPGPRPTSIPSGILIHPTVWPQHANVTDRQTDRQTGQDRQRSDNIGRTVLQTVAQKLNLNLNLNHHPSLATAHVCVSLCTTVVQNIAQNRSDNFPSYPLDNHHRHGPKSGWGLLCPFGKRWVPV